MVGGYNTKNRGVGPDTSSSSIAASATAESTNNNAFTNSISYYTIVETETHGKAMIATQDINPGPHGITILQEKALLTVPPNGSELDLSGEPPSILDKFDPQIWTDWWKFKQQTCVEKQKCIMETMYYEMDCDHAIWLLNFLSEKQQLLHDGKLQDPFKCKLILDHVEEFVKYTMIIRFNSVNLHPPDISGNGPGIYYGHGIFVDACKMSHSCKPNCVWHSSFDGQSKIVRAITPIKLGQELTIDYIGGEMEPVVYRRKELLDSKGFLCECIRCGRLPKSTNKKEGNKPISSSVNASQDSSLEESAEAQLSSLSLQRHHQQQREEDESKEEQYLRGDDTRRFKCISTATTIGTRSNKKNPKRNNKGSFSKSSSSCYGVHFLIQPLETSIARLTNCSVCGAKATDEYVQNVMDMESDIFDEINELRETIETTNENVDERIENLRPPHPLHCLAAKCYMLRGEHYSRNNQHVLAAKEYAKQVACRMAILGNEYYSEGTAWCVERLGDELLHVNVNEAEIAYKRTMRSLHMMRGHPIQDPYVNCVVRKVSNIQNRKLDFDAALPESNGDSLPCYDGVTNIALCSLSSDGVTNETLQPICNNKSGEIPCDLCGNVSKITSKCQFQECSHVGNYCCKDHRDLHWSLVHEKHCPNNAAPARIEEKREEGDEEHRQRNRQSRPQSSSSSESVLQGVWA